jgi:5,10-methylenetetrahydromethanopterin reductase
MNAGVLFLPDVPTRRLAGLAHAAEALGYDHFWLADERFYREVYGTLAACAAATERIFLGPCVTDPYSRHPALTAMAIATLDEISDGRAALGIGAGVTGFAQLGIQRVRPARAIRESIELVRRLLAGERLDYKGEVIQFQGGGLSFTPARASIPIYVASNGPLGQRTAGAFAKGAIMEACATPEEVRTFVATVRRGAEEAGRDPAAVEVVVRLNTCISDDGKAARDVLRLRVARTLANGVMRFETIEAQGITLPPEAKGRIPHGVALEAYEPLVPLITDRFVDAFTLAGTPTEVAEHLIALGRAGIDGVIINPFAPPGGAVEDTMRRFGADVLPRAREALGGSHGEDILSL